MTQNKLQIAYQYINNNQMVEAEKLLKEILNNDRGNSDAWSGLGILAGISGDLNKAEELFQRAVTLTPNLHQAWSNLGLTLYRKGNYEKARHCLSEALALRPDDPFSHNTMGTVLRELGQIDTAIKHYRAAISGAPEYSEAYSNLGNILQERCLFKEAEECYLKAIALSPQSIDSIFNLGTLFQKTGKQKDAVEQYRKALLINPAYTRARIAIADVLEKEQKYEEAYNELRPLLQADVNFPDLAITFSKISNSLDRESEAKVVLEQALAGNWPLIENQRLHYALGELLDREHKYDEAFAHFDTANSLRRYDFNFREYEVFFEEIKQAFSKESISTLPSSSNNSGRPVFIVGMPRSGTTLIEQILCRHPSVFGGGELLYIDDISRSLSQQLAPGSRHYFHGIGKLTEDMLNRYAADYLDRIGKLNASSTFVTDKMPYNFLEIGLIHLLFPRARIIHCSRNAIDTCLSIYFHDFSSNHPYATSLTALGSYHKLYEDLMMHWKEILPAAIHTVYYDDLVSDFETVCKELVEFCSLEWSDDFADFHKSKRVALTPSYNQVRSPIYQSSSNRHKNYQKHIQNLLKILE